MTAQEQRDWEYGQPLTIPRAALCGEPVPLIMESEAA